MKRPNHGFTLIELSIVLVLIGLIVGGILVGRDLIQAAEIRQQVSNLGMYTTAINIFTEKFIYMPGNEPLAARSRFGMPAPDYPMENAVKLGNGKIDTDDTCDYTPLVCDAPQPEYVFVDLSWANLVQGSYHNMWGIPGTWIGSVWPPLTFNKSAGLMAFTYNESVNYFLGMTTETGSTNFHIDNQSLHGVMTPMQAYAIDAKIDDGVPSTGGVLAIIQPAYLPATDNVPAQCVIDSTALTYNINNNGQWCKLLVRSQ